MKGKHLRLRNCLNLVFMVGAVAGVIVHLFINNDIGTYIILCAIVPKMVESCMRISDSMLFKKRDADEEDEE